VRVGDFIFGLDDFSLLLLLFVQLLVEQGVQVVDPFVTHQDVRIEFVQFLFKVLLVCHVFLVAVVRAGFDFAQTFFEFGSEFVEVVDFGCLFAECLAFECVFLLTLGEFESEFLDLISKVLFGFVQLVAGILFVLVEFFGQVGQLLVATQQLVVQVCDAGLLFSSGPLQFISQVFVLAAKAFIDAPQVFAFLFELL